MTIQPQALSFRQLNYKEEMLAENHILLNHYPPQQSFCDIMKMRRFINQKQERSYKNGSSIIGKIILKLYGQIISYYKPLIINWMAVLLRRFHCRRLCS